MDLRPSFRVMSPGILSGPLFLDGRTDVAAAFSLRRVRSAYQGGLVRVRRSSDSTEQDFGSGLPAVNWADVLAFIGAGNGFVSKWYEQSNGRDLSQSTAAKQPQIILASTGLPTLLGDGVDDVMTTASFGMSQPISFNVVYRRVTAASVVGNLFSSSAADAVTLYHSDSIPSGNSMYSGTEFHSNATAQPTGTRGAVGGCFNAASSLMEVNGATVSSFTGDAGTSGFDGLTLFTNFVQSGTREDNSEVQELILFNGGGAHSSVQLKSDNAAMRSAWGF